MTENKLAPAVEDINNKLINSTSDETKEIINTKITEAVKSLTVAFGCMAQAVQIVCEKITPFVEPISFYPNKKVKHLALHSKKARVRNKNRNRILKDLGMK